MIARSVADPGGMRGMRPHPPQLGQKICERQYFGHCRETADQIRMPFVIIGQTGPGMRQLVGFGDWSTGRGTFGGEFRARHCNQWGLLRRTCTLSQRRGPLYKLLWPYLLLLLLSMKTPLRVTNKNIAELINLKFSCYQYKT